MQGVQYSKDTAKFEETVVAKQKEKLLVMLASAGVFLCMSICLLLLGSKSALSCNTEGDLNTEAMVTCSDLSTLYTCPPLPVRIAMVLQGTDDSYIRFNSACKWSPALVQIRLLIILIAAITVYQGFSGLYSQENSQIRAFILLVPVAISLLIALVLIDLKGNAGLLEYENELLNVLTGSNFEGLVQTLTFSFSTFYVYSPTAAYLGAAGLIVTTRAAIDANIT